MSLCFLPRSAAFTSAIPVTLPCRFSHALQVSCKRRRPPLRTPLRTPKPSTSQPTALFAANGQPFSLFQHDDDERTDNEEHQHDQHDQMNDDDAYDSAIPDNMPPPPERLPPLFVDERTNSFWKSVDTDDSFAPIRPEEEAVLRERIPKRFANFLLARADDAVRLRSPRSRADNSFIGQLLNELPPDTPDWDSPVNAEYRDYVYVTTTGPPSFRRKGSSLFGGGDGLPDLDDQGLVGDPYVDHQGDPVIRPAQPPGASPASHPRLMSLFVGQVDSIDEQAGRTGYALLAVFALWISLKLFFGIISFFLSFTFSFFAIFALSAGIFVLFFFLKF